MDNFSELIREAIAGGDDLESAMRKAANQAAKEAIMIKEIELFTKRVVISSDRIGLLPGKWPSFGSNTIPKGLFFPRFCPL